MKTFLFDLDGTLLPMEQELFINKYFNELAKVSNLLGYDAKQLLNSVLKGIKSMVSNDGSATNRERFWDTFVTIYGEHILYSEQHFITFYKNEFHKVKDATNPNPLAGECVRILKEKNYRLVLATNPIFPEVATLARINWAGLNPEDFDVITTYENSCFCKPNLEYYKEILEKCNSDIKDCIMIGNDVSEDMCVSKLGMDTFLLNENIINEKNEDISKYKQGSMRDFYEFVLELPYLD